MSDETARGYAGRRPKYRASSTAPSMTRPPRQLEGVGRNSARLYCPDCGQKRTVCTCRRASS